MKINEKQKEWRRRNPDKVKVINERRRPKQKEYARKRRKTNPEANHMAYKKYTSTVKGHLATLIRNARARAKKANLKFEIDRDFLLKLWENQAGICFVSGQEMTTKKGTGRNPTNATLDRINPKKGYVPGNVRLVCYRINEMKSDGTDIDLEMWCRHILRNGIDTLEDQLESAYQELNWLEAQLPI